MTPDPFEAVMPYVEDAFGIQPAKTKSRYAYTGDREQREVYLRALLTAYQHHVPLLNDLRAGLTRHDDTIERLLISSVTVNNVQQLVSDLLFSPFGGLRPPEGFIAFHEMIDVSFGRNEEIHALLVDCQRVAEQAGIRAPWATGWILTVWLRHVQFRPYLPEHLRDRPIDLHAAPGSIGPSPMVTVSVPWEREYESIATLKERLHAAVDQQVQELTAEESTPSPVQSAQHPAVLAERVYHRVALKWGWRRIAKAAGYTDPDDPPDRRGLSHNAVKTQIETFLTVLDLS